jgi:Holliday junction DNA helicase RuvA
LQGPAGKGLFDKPEEVEDNQTAMMYSISGKLMLKGDGFAVIDAGGVGFKIAASGATLKALPAVESEGALRATLFTHLNVKEDALDLYGFATEEERDFFEMLIGVSGVGPKSALAMIDTGPLNELAAAIKENRPDLLTRAAGIGRKTAERVILELKAKVESAGSGAMVQKMETDSDLVEALASLGYRRDEARAALARVREDAQSPEDRLKAALKILSGKE